MTNNVTRADVNVVARPQPCAFTSSRHGLLLYAYTQEESSGKSHRWSCHASWLQL